MEEAERALREWLATEAVLRFGGGSTSVGAASA